MTMLDSTQAGAPRRFSGLFIALICAVELVSISLVYQHSFAFVCRDVAPAGFCAIAGRAVPRAIAILAALALFAAIRKTAIRPLMGQSRLSGPAVTRYLAGFAMVILPWFFVAIPSTTTAINSAMALWTVGGAAITAGLMLLLAPASAWGRVIRLHGWTLAALIAVGAALPEIADRVQPLWRFDWITDITFFAVGQVLDLMGYGYTADPAFKMVGNDDFAVLVGPSCSGVEGFALISIFLAIYMTLFRADLRFPQAFLLLPLGLLLSWCFNVLRIAALVSIGFEGAPELATGAFHSHAGWLSFTALSIGLILTSRAMPYFTRAARRTNPPVPFFSDPAVAQLFPFAIFMAAGLILSTVSQTPSLLYPIRTIAVGAAVIMVWPYIRKLAWRLDPIALCSGVAIGMLWVVTALESDAPAPYGALTGAMFAAWAAARLIGTAVLVPIVEEMTFRGYIQSRLAPQGASTLRIVIAISITTALFAVLHDRWLAAAVAGVVFSLLALRRRNVTDAITAHATANLSIGVWAFVTGAWHII